MKPLLIITLGCLTFSVLAVCTQTSTPASPTPSNHPNKPSVSNPPNLWPSVSSTPPSTTSNHQPSNSKQQKRTMKVNYDTSRPTMSLHEMEKLRAIEESGCKEQTITVNPDDLGKFTTAPEYAHIRDGISSPPQMARSTAATAANTIRQPLNAAVIEPWFHVDDDLPDDDIMVLTYSEEDDHYTLAHRDAGKWVESSLLIEIHPSHWMHLPEPPTN